MFLCRTGLERRVRGTRISLGSRDASRCDRNKKRAGTSPAPPSFLLPERPHMTRPPLLLALSVLALLSAAGARAEDRKPPLPPFRTIALLPADDKKHLLNDNFTIVKTVREMPAPIQHLLIPDTKTRANGMADAGQGFQATDVVHGKLPYRRLVLAAVNAQYCLVYFERGGRAYSQHLTLFRLQNGRAGWGWGSDLIAWPPLTFSELRSALRNDKHQASAASSYRASRSRRNSS